MFKFEYSFHIYLGILHTHLLYLQQFERKWCKKRVELVKGEHDNLFVLIFNSVYQEYYACKSVQSFIIKCDFVCVLMENGRGNALTDDKKCARTDDNKWD